MSILPTTDEVQGPAIHARGLEKAYKELRVLRGVDFEVARGSVFALLGSNGAGKTTVVRILSTLLRADAGTARVNGFDVVTQAAGVRGSISLTGQFGRSTGSSAGGRTSSWSPDCGMSRTLARSRTTC
ncbi:ATP-binding cassette domain-containing protein [Nonomuraea cavernae]|nr:ATP-binding cassette domain-containing protein [Nonomuraea cavernae]